MRKLPPLAAVRAFEAAARHASFAVAAEELHVTPSAISHQVKLLEEHFGVELFHRRHREVSLTRHAGDYLRSITQALDQIDAASQRLMARPHGNQLTLSVAPTFAMGWLVPRMTEFQVDHPEIEIRMSTAVAFAADFAEHDVDVAIAYGLGDWPSVHADLLLTEHHLVPLCSPALLERRPLSGPDDIRYVTLLHVLPRIGQWRNWLKTAGVTGVDAERGPKFQSTPLAIEAAKASLGLAISSRDFVSAELARGELVVPFDVDLPSESGYYLLFPEERIADPKVKAFREWLLAKLKRDPATA